MKNRLMWLAVLPCIMALPAFGQNLLLNGSFALPGDPANQACPPGGLHGAPDNWTVDVGSLDRNGTVHIMACPRAADDTDSTYAYWSNGGAGAKSRFYQTYTFPAGQEPNGTDSYKFNGWYGGGKGNLPITIKFGIVAGDNTAITESNTGTESIVTKYITGTTAWTSFTITWAPPAGTTQLTVYASAQNGGDGFNAVWYDSFVLEQENLCPNQPAIDSISPEMGQRGTTVIIDLNGSNFANTPTAQLTGPQTINATSVTVETSTLAHASFDLPANAPNGQYNLVYDQSPCSVVTVSNAFSVYLESLQNGSFETPSASQACLAEAIGSDYWLLQLVGTSGWPNGLVKNGWVDPAADPTGPLDFLPTCPIDGNNYGTLSSKRSGNAIIYYQTIAAQPNKQYVVSGKFAASGDVNSAIRIFEGDLNGAMIGDKRVANGPRQQFDWRTDFAAGTTSGTAATITVGWMADTGSATAMKAVHADGLQVAICDSPIEVTAMTPGVAVAGGTLSVTSLAGTGFSGTPTIELHGPSNTIMATAVTVVSSTQITFEADLTTAEAGSYEVLVIQGNCMAALADALLVIQPELVNGGFELPTAPVDHGSCTSADPPQTVPGLPTGWNTDAPSGLVRDGSAPLPPNDGNACISSSDGGHYASMSYDNSGSLRAWQTVAVNPGVRYNFSGEFSAGPGVTVTLRLLDGDENGTEIQSAVVTLVAGQWAPGSVEGIAPSSGIMTVMWQMDVSGVAPDVGGHADGLQLISPCNVPFADADGDGDVDQVDFSVFQLCFTGTTGGVPANPDYCSCFDRDGNGDINQSDAAAFEVCASGPGIPADPGCE